MAGRQTFYFPSFFSTSKKQAMQQAVQLKTFLDNSPSPFHAVHESVQLLKASGFTQLSPLDLHQTHLHPSGRYFFTKNSSTLVAFCIGSRYKAGNGFAIVGAHTDSPSLKLKPTPATRTKNGFLQVGVQTYGGGLWNTWFDRDLAIAGRVVYREENSTTALPSSYPKLQQTLVKIDKPCLRIPSLAIHLNPSIRTDGFKFNNEAHLVPVAGVGNVETDFMNELVASSLSHLHVKPSQITETELVLYDYQKAEIGGINDDFIFSGRLDNLLMSWCALKGFLEAPITDTSSVLMLVLFDNEEVGSVSAAGADSSLLQQTIQYIVSAFAASPQQPLFLQTVAKSFFISADCAHSVHPNYAEVHEDQHRPIINEGLVIKTNANQRYATNAISSSILKQVAQQHSVKVQEFCVRNDSGCGSTIGPIVAGNLSMLTVDVGNAQLSMHSVREMAGVADIDNSVRLFRGFYSDFDKIDMEIQNS